VILHVILTTALSASAATHADSVRSVAKQATPRPDSTVLALPAPTISAPTLPAPSIAPPQPLARIAPRHAGEALSTSTQTIQAVQQSGSPKGASLLAMLTPADASAVTRSAGNAPTNASGSAGAATAPSAPVLTADGRIVTGTKSTVTFEPLHAVPIPPSGLRLSAPAAADSIVVYKRERTLTLFFRGVPVRSYFVALGGKPVGDKERIGDQRTPEGLFYIDAHNPASKYHLALHISYPDAAHRARAEKLGVEPGNDIMIHGLPDKYSSVGKEHRLDDWTNGCVALTNSEIEEIWHAVPDGTPVQIKP